LDISLSWGQKRDWSLSRSWEGPLETIWDPYHEGKRGGEKREENFSQSFQMKREIV